LAKKSRQGRETWRDERAIQSELRLWQNPAPTARPFARFRQQYGRCKRKPPVVETGGNAREGIGSVSGGLILRAIGRAGVLLGHRQIGDGIVHARDGVGFA